MRRKQYCFLVCLLVIAFLTAVTGRATAQQAPQFTQFMLNNMVLNPAYAGAEEALTLTVLTRGQWSGVDGAPSTQCLSAHTLLRSQRVGLGLAVVRDQIGVHKNTNIRTNYAYHLPVHNRGILSMGIQAGVTTLKSDYASLLGNSNDPQLMSNVNKTFLGFGAGIYYRTTHWCAGLSIPELMSKTLAVQDTLTVRVRRTNVLGYARYSFMVNESIDIEPAILLKYYAGVPVSADINLNVVYRKALTGGLSYRKGESIDLLMRFQLTPQLQLGYAYDHPVGSAGQLSSASHELMVSYRFSNIQMDVESPR
ncbi:type IX secretion system membrane protein PorP/SprF [Fulvivirgaceae bacterium PWU5]|uniref:Type IX secretion system membrane protein PorP/SprF n=1 Tax=Dawidia cretensis TaxID=2782350 RepID=A0AAP2GSX7_9BACT|nr:type IX secretion system membrane protein PorP/SprF [Dawidia cretensis]MBT1711644.1 type IX secretion system membrane protein PorP/SprF [Dawidia cretensis]